MLLTLLTCTACEKEIDKYYDRPDFLKGNAYEFMVSRGNFKHFLQAAELVGYDNILNGRGLCTVMAPTDEAFEQWLQKHNYSSLSDVPKDDLTTLVTSLLVQNAYEEDYMLSFHMNSESGNKGDGLAYKFKTYCTPAPRMMTDPLTGNRINMGSRQRYLSVVSTRMFQALKCTDYASNYKFFFPNVNWQGEDDKLYVGEAAVTEAAIPTDNGYVYILDKVAEPLRTIYQAIEQPAKNEFSDFLRLYDRFAETSVKSTTDGDTLYHYNHYRMASKSGVQIGDQLPCLASEWSYHGELNGARPYYELYMRYTYNCFAPTNAALQDFYQQYFSGFNSIDDIPQLTLYYLLKAHVREQQTIMMPENFETNGVKGEYGEKWDLTRSNVINPEFCTNGLLYGIDKVFKPTMFDIITKPLFSTPDFAITANMFFKSGEFVTLVDPTPDRFTLFIQADTTLVNQYNMNLDYGTDYFNDSNEKVKLDNTVLDATTMQTMVESHIVNGAAIRDFNTRAFYGMKNPFTYVYTEGGEIHGENGAPLEILKSWETTNGPTYQISGMLEKNDVGSIDMLKNNYKDFYDLLKTAGVIVTKDKIDQFADISEGERAIIFAPANGVLNKTQLSALPKEELAQYLRYFIVSLNANVMSDYILPNYGSEMRAKTLRTNEELTTPYQKVYSEIDIRFSGNSLSLTNEAGTQNILTNGDVPFFATDGLIYCITDVIQPK